MNWQLKKIVCIKNRIEIDSVIDIRFNLVSVNYFKMFLSYSFEILGVIASFGEVENMIPFVDFLLFLAFVDKELTDDVGCFGVVSEIRVLDIVGTESDSGTAFDDGVVGGVQVHFRIVEVSAPELGSCHRDFAIVAVDEEDRPLDRSDVEFGVLAAVDRDLGGVL